MILRLYVWLIWLDVLIDEFITEKYKKLKPRRKDSKIFKYIDELPIWNFDMCLEKKDLRYLLKLKNYRELPDTDFNFEPIFDDLIEQIECTFDPTTSQKSLLIKERNLSTLIDTYTLTASILNSMKIELFDSGDYNDSIEMLASKELRVKNKLFKHKDKHMSAIDTELFRNESKINRIKIAREDYERSKKAIHKGKNTPLRKEAMILRTRFPGVIIDVKKMSVQEWFTLKEMAHEEDEERKRNNKH